MRALFASGCGALLLLGCGAAPDAGLVFAKTPSQQVSSQSGALQLDVYEQVDLPVARGVNAVKLQITPASARSGLTLAVTTWMPAMGHGSAVTPTVEPIEGGFVVTEISFPMAGTWELRGSFGGSLSDQAIITYDIQ
jgi:hypothetical protein